jgi:(p)ppGpp synthase/HD superfamily hydrolase
MSSNKSKLTNKFEEALVYANHLHAEQKRKRSLVPYIAHLLGVTSLVLEDGGNEDEAIAALLHDAVEDQGGLDTLEEIRLRFGDIVAEIVLSVSDSFTDPKPPWREISPQLARQVLRHYVFPWPIRSITPGQP